MYNKIFDPKTRKNVSIFTKKGRNILMKYIQEGGILELDSSKDSFIENTFQKVNDLKSLIQKKNSKALIEIDGGVNSNNAKKLIEQGADVLVAGSFVFRSHDPTKTISDLSVLINQFIAFFYLTRITLI